jgi:hypothetical protein
MKPTYTIIVIILAGLASGGVAYYVIGKLKSDSSNRCDEFSPEVEQIIESPIDKPDVSAGRPPVKRLIPRDTWRGGGH